MKKITDKKIAEELNLTRQSIFNMKKKRPKQYAYIKAGCFLDKNNFEKKIQRAYSFLNLLTSEGECKGKYLEDLKKELEELKNLSEYTTKILKTFKGE